MRSSLWLNTSTLEPNKRNRVKYAFSELSKNPRETHTRGNCSGIGLFYMAFQLEQRTYVFNYFFYWTFIQIYLFQLNSGLATLKIPYFNVLKIWEFLGKN